jgi:hypothetical protein
MKLPIGARFAPAWATVALAASLAIPAAGAAPVAAAGTARVCDDSVAPSIWILPLTSAKLTFGLGESKVFRVYVRNNWTCASLGWSATNVVRSVSGHVWRYGPAGPTSGVVPPGSTGTTAFVVTAPPFYSPRADVYIAVYTAVRAPGFHWSVGMTDLLD